MMNPRSQSASAQAVVIPGVPIQRWGVDTCGAGALSTVLQRWGEPVTMADLETTLPKIRGGVLTIDMLIAARKKGYEASIVTGTPELVERELEAGRPVILMLQSVQYPGVKYDFFHYVVADGIDRQRSLIRTQFGDGTGRWVRWNRLEKPWAGGGHAALLVKPASFETALRGAVTAESEGRLDEAATAYRKLLASHPGSALVWTNLANVQSQLGQKSEAENSLRKALAIDPGHRDALNNLAWLLYSDRRLEEAETFARNALAQDGPDTWVVLDTLARVQVAKGDCAGAQATFRHALSLVPSSQAEARADLEKGLRNAGACGK